MLKEIGVIMSLNMDEKISVKNLCEWTVSFKRLDVMGDVHVRDHVHDDGHDESDHESDHENDYDRENVHENVHDHDHDYVLVHDVNHET